LSVEERFGQLTFTKLSNYINCPRAAQNIYTSVGGISDLYVNKERKDLRPFALCVRSALSFVGQAWNDTSKGPSKLSVLQPRNSYSDV